MSLPARQRRALDRIDQKLAVDDPRLGSMFATFTRLTLDQPMPATERVSSRLRRLLPSIVISIALIAGLTVLTVSMPTLSTNTCGFTIAESRLAQTWGRTRTCRPALPNPAGPATFGSGGGLQVVPVDLGYHENDINTAVYRQIAQLCITGAQRWRQSSNGWTRDDGMPCPCTETDQRVAAPGLNLPTASVTAHIPEAISMPGCQVAVASFEQAVKAVAEETGRKQGQ